MAVTFSVHPGLTRVGGSRGPAWPYGAAGEVELRHARGPTPGLVWPPAELWGRRVATLRSRTSAAWWYGHANSFVLAAASAFANHRPLVLSPDDVWSCIAQGFARHVRENSETMRSRFVTHAGKLELMVRDDRLAPGRPDNDWSPAVAQLVACVGDHVGKTHELLTDTFSTTSSVERVAAQIVLLDSFEAYFGYTVRSYCGIPKMTLLGEARDWIQLRQRAAVLTEFDLGWWMEALLPALDHFVDAAEGRADAEVWRSFVKWREQSGGCTFNGWINALFPYSGAGKRRWSEPPERFEGAKLGDFPRGVSIVPFNWKYSKQELPMCLGAGFLGIHEDAESGALRPVLGWWVGPDSARGPSPRR